MIGNDIVDLEARHGMRSSFYFAATAVFMADGHPVDVVYDVGSPGFRRQLKRLQRQGAEVGLHMGYNAWQRSGQLRREVDRLADALGGPGVIEVATSDDGKTYRIEINDSGPGIPQDVRDRIFEPFFTTKPVGSGTGLGLAIAYAVVRAHKGEISVGDGPLGGARFLIELPMDDQA